MLKELNALNEKISIANEDDALLVFEKEVIPLLKRLENFVDLKKDLDLIKIVDLSKLILEKIRQKSKNKKFNEVLYQFALLHYANFFARKDKCLMSPKSAALYLERIEAYFFEAKDALKSLEEDEGFLQKVRAIRYQKSSWSFSAFFERDTAEKFLKAIEVVEKGGLDQVFVLGTAEDITYFLNALCKMGDFFFKKFEEEKSRKASLTSYQKCLSLYESAHDSAVREKSVFLMPEDLLSEYTVAVIKHNIASILIQMPQEAEQFKMADRYLMESNQVFIEKIILMRNKIQPGKLRKLPGELAILAKSASFLKDSLGFLDFIYAVETSPFSKKEESILFNLIIYVFNKEQLEKLFLNKPEVDLNFSRTLLDFLNPPLTIRQIQESALNESKYANFLLKNVFTENLKKAEDNMEVDVLVSDSHQENRLAATDMAVHDKDEIVNVKKRKAIDVESDLQETETPRKKISIQKEDASLDDLGFQLPDTSLFFPANEVVTPSNNASTDEENSSYAQIDTEKKEKCEPKIFLQNASSHVFFAANKKSKKSRKMVIEEDESDVEDEPDANEVLANTSSVNRQIAIKINLKGPRGPQIKAITYLVNQQQSAPEVFVENTQNQYASNEKNFDVLQNVDNTAILGASITNEEVDKLFSDSDEVIDSRYPASLNITNSRG